MLTGIVFAIVAFAIRQAVASQRPTKGRIEMPEPPDPVTLLPIYEALASAPENAPIKLVGRVRAHGTSFTSAIGGEPCVACLVGAAVWHSKKVPQLVANLRDCTAAPFTLVLSDGEVEVGEATKVECATRKTSRHPARELAVLARHQLERHADSSEFTEGTILDGDRVTVVGVLVRARGGEQGYRDHVNQLMVAGTGAQPLTVFKAKK